MRVILASLLATLALAATATAAPFNVIANGTFAYKIDGVDNPTLHLVRGHTYQFAVNASGHPFFIKTEQITGTASQYNNGVTGNGASNGTITWVIPTNAPTPLYYNCQFHEAMVGEIQLTDPVPGMNGLTAGVLLVLLLGGAGLTILRRRTA